MCEESFQVSGNVPQDLEAVSPSGPVLRYMFELRIPFCFRQ